MEIKVKVELSEVEREAIRITNMVCDKIRGILLRYGANIDIPTIESEELFSIYCDTEEIVGKKAKYSFAEIIFDLTEIATRFDWSDFDSRDICSEVYRLAEEFDKSFCEDEDYLTEIEEFGEQKLSEFFGKGKEDE